MFDLMPFGRDDRNFFNYLDNVERNFFGNAFGEMRQFRTDIVDQGDQYLLKAELPGFDKKDINIDISDHTLTIRAQQNAEIEEKKENYVRRERKFGSFCRSFDISNIKADEIKAEYKNGILELSLPKADPTSNSSRQIDIQ